MSPSDWNWRYPVELQNVPWDCAAASLCWCLNAMGYQTTEAQVVAGLGPARITPTWGLMDASGAGLVEYLSEIGIAATNDPDASWESVVDLAGNFPMLVGGRAWCHWTGVRMGSAAAGLPTSYPLALANPAPGWMGIDQLLEREDWDQLGPWSSVILELPSTDG